VAALSVSDHNAVLRARIAGRPFVWWLDGACNLHILELDTARRISIGRAPEHDVVFTRDDVSWVHAELFAVQDTWYVRDRDSTNGTFAQGRPASPELRLREQRTTIGLGRGVVVHVELPAEQLGDAPHGTRRDSLSAVAVLPTLTPTQHLTLVALCSPQLARASIGTATNREVAAELHLSEAAVKSRLRDLYARYGISKAAVRAREELAARALAEGLAEIAHRLERPPA
jgi:DNA-binding CsgD family transcriptional regulator